MTTPTTSSTTPPTAPVQMTATKAWVAGAVSGLLAFLSSLATALGGAETGFDSITAGQWLTAVIAGLTAFLTALGFTFAVPNRPK